MSIELKIGKRYRNRIGEIVKITNKSDWKDYDFEDETGRPYTVYGSYFADGIVSQFDLIEEVEDEPITEFLVGKTYKCRNGQNVKIIAIEPSLRDPIIGLIEGEDRVLQFYKCGRYSLSGNHPYDIILNPYQDFKIDNPVMYLVKGGWKKGYFAGFDVKRNKPTVFAEGRTSFSGSHSIIPVEHVVSNDDFTDDMIILEHQEC